MKFGKVEHPEIIDFTLPKDHPDTKKVLSKFKNSNPPRLYVGCAKWNRADLRGFYPRGTKDELEYYSTQFNSIELNATFHRNFPSEIFESWYRKTSVEFRFFPKFFQGISHWRRLQNCEENLNQFILNSSNLKEKLEMYFVQLPANFRPKNIDRLEPFFKMLPRNIRPAIEFRHSDWLNDVEISEEVNSILKEYKITNIIVDTAGRRDLLHMSLTTPNAFIRYNSAYHEIDYS